MKLLVCVLNHKDKLEEVLAGFLEIGITGATIVESQGMGRVLEELPAVAHLMSLKSGTRPDNVTILSVVETDKMLEDGISMIQNICGDMNNPSTGIAFAVPVSNVVGMAPKLES